MEQGRLAFTAVYLKSNHGYIGYVLSMVHAHMVKYPESSVGPYLKVRDKLGKKAA